MSCKVTMVNNKPNSYVKKEFLCDIPDDINSLPRYNIKGTIDDPNDSAVNNPCAIGSTALVCSTSEVYILAPNNEWVLL